MLACKKGTLRCTLPRHTPDLRAVLGPWLREHHYRPPLLPGMQRRDTDLDPGKLAADVQGQRA